MEVMVKIRHWRQDNMESGRWVLTDSMKESTAHKLIESELFEDAEIINDE